MAIAFGESFKQLGLETQGRAGVDRIEPVKSKVGS